MTLLHVAARFRYRFHHFGNGSVIKPFPRRIDGTQYMSIGENCFFSDGLVMVVSDFHQDSRPAPVLSVGDGCVFGADAYISCTYSITIGANVLTSGRVLIADSYHGYSNPLLPVLQQPMEGDAAIVIGDGSFIGIGCAILPGVKLGKNCFVGANAVVTNSFEDYSIVAGIPARLIKRYDVQKKAWVKV